MKKFVTLNMAMKNLQRRPVRSWCMIFFVFMLAASLFLSTVLTDSLSDSLEKTTNRMGADVIVVPEEYERDMVDALFQGTISSFSFDKQWLNEITDVPGIAKSSPQLYLKTLAADCCSTSVQLIAFDPETDFIITSWLEDDGIEMPKKGEVIVGSKITPEADGNIIFFGKPYKVKGQLEETRSNYDACVFMTYETAEEIVHSEKWIAAFGEAGSAENMVSCLMIRAEQGMDKKDIAGYINYRLSKDCPVRAYTMNGLLSGAMETVNSMDNYSTILMILISILVIAALLCIFTITINERTKEFGILSSLGAGSGKLAGLVLSEGCVIGLAGGIIGVVFSVAALLIFGNTIVVLMEIPKLTTKLSYLLPLGLKCLALALVVSIVASLYSAWKVSRNHLDALIRGEEM